MARLLWTYGASLMALFCSTKGNQFDVAPLNHALSIPYSKRALTGASVAEHVVYKVLSKVRWRQRR